MGAFDRVKSWFGGGYRGAEEGSWRGPFTFFGEFGNGYQLTDLEDGWQRHLTPGMQERVASVYACVMMNARAVSQCTPKHLIENSLGAYEQSKTSPVSRIFREPNSYETFNQLITNTVADVLFKGESIWVGVRDDRNVITDVHRMPSGSWGIHVEPESKAVFYTINSNGDFPYEHADYMVPARDVCHFRMHAPRHPLVGESAIAHAAMAIGINVALTKSQAAFFNNMNRASGILETDEPLTSEQKEQARQAFSNQSKHWNQGGLPVLSHGVKYNALSLSSQDAQVIEAQKMSRTEICNVFGVPPVLLDDSGAPMAGTEATISHWLAVGLGSVIESFERSLEKFFKLPASHQIQLDPSPLLRVEHKDRIDALVKAVQGGLLTPYEARQREGYGEKDGADELFLQRQMTPVSILRALNDAELEAATNPPEPAPVQEPGPPAESQAEKEAAIEIGRAKVIQLLSGAKNV